MRGVVEAAGTHRGHCARSMVWVLGVCGMHVKARLVVYVYGGLQLYVGAGTHLCWQIKSRQPARP
jgi:hypothetical protein